MGRSYDQIKKIADRLGWPKSFRRDVTYHDRRYLGNYEGDLLWSVSSNGTHIQRADLMCRKAEDLRGGPTHLGGAWRELADQRVFGDERIYRCNGNGCQEITQRKAEAVMDILRGWLADCPAPYWRKNQLLAGMRRRRSRGKQR